MLNNNGLLSLQSSCALFVIVVCFGLGLLRLGGVSNKLRIWIRKVNTNAIKAG